MQPGDNTIVLSPGGNEQTVVNESSGNVETGGNPVWHIA